MIRTLELRYNQKLVCCLQLPLVARHKGRLPWAYIGSTWIDELYEKYKPRENIFREREKRTISEKGLLISPFCMAIMLAMAQQASPQQRVTLFLSSHERRAPPNSAQIIYIIHKYTLEASQAYLRKFDEPYEAFEANLTVHRQTIPLQKKTFEALFWAVQRGTTEQKHDDYQAEKVVDAVKDGTATLYPYPADLNKRKALEVSDSNIPSKRVKSNSRKEG